MRPSFLIGGDVNEIGTNAVWDSGEWIVLEADESDGTFLQLAPEIAVVTNVEADHLDYYGDFDRSSRPSTGSWRRRRGEPIVGADDEVAARLGGGAGRSSWGPRPRLHLPHRGPRRRERRLVHPAGPRGGARTRGAAGDRGQHRPQRGGGGGGVVATSARPSMPPSGPWPASPGSPGASSPGARRTGCASSTTTRTCPREVAAVIDAARATAPGPSGGGVPAAPLQPDRGLGRAVRRRLHGGRRRGRHRRLRRR